MPLQKRNSQLIDLLAGTFLKRNDPVAALAQLMGLYLSIPGLRGFWPGSGFGVDGSGTSTFNDLSGNGLHLLANGNVQQQVNGIAPRIRFVATASQYLSHPSTDVLNYRTTNVTSTYQGLTLGGWFYHLTDTVTRGYISKWRTAGNQRGYALLANASGVPSASVSSDGSAFVSVIAGSAISIATWHFVAARFRPGQELALFVDGQKYTNTINIPSAIHASTADLTIGAHNGASFFDGYAAFCFLAGTQVFDATINAIYSYGRHVFGI